MNNVFAVVVLLVVVLFVNGCGDGDMGDRYEEHLQRQQSPRDAALLEAAEKGRAEDVASLLDQGADEDAVDRRGTTALLLAADRCSTETVKLLLDAGADEDAVDRHRVRANIGRHREVGTTALMLAAKCDNAGMVALLLDEGADVDAESEGGTTALMVAAARSRAPRKITHLLNAGADVNAAPRTAPLR